MNAPRTRRTALLTVALLAPALGPAGAGGPDAAREGAFDGSRVQWSQARLGASKFFMSLDVDITLELVSAAAATASLGRHSTFDGLAAPAHTLSMRYFSEGFGRTSRVEMLLDPASGSMLRRSTHDTGNRYRLRVYRYAQDKVLRLTRRPGNGEETRAPEAWSRFAEEIHVFPKHRPVLPVTEPAALIYLAAASGIRQAGDEFTIAAWSDDLLYTVSVRATGMEKLRHDYTLTTAGGSDKQKGRSEVLRIVIDGQLAGSQEHDDDEAFELLGLRDVELFLDPESRAPIMLTGRIPKIGQVEFELERLTLATVSDTAPDPAG